MNNSKEGKSNSNSQKPSAQTVRPRDRITSVRLSEEHILFAGKNGNYLHVDTEGKISEKVLTPGGFRSALDVTVIESNSVIKQNKKSVVQTGSDGIVLSKKSLTANKTSPVLKTNSGWVVDAVWFNDSGQAVSSFRAAFTVPPEPIAQNDQIIYLFAAVERAAGDDILQPVLQWSTAPSGSGQCWSVFSMWVNSSGTVHQTTPVRVEPGQIVTALISLNSGSTEHVLDYTCEFEGIPETKFSLGTEGELGIDVWCAITLEAYNIRFPKKDYPNTAKSIVSHISVLQSGANPVINWQVQTANARFGEKINLVTDGAQNALMEIVYQSS